MLELWRRVVIGSAVAVYLAGLACAGSLLLRASRPARVSHRVTALVPDPLASAAGTGSRR